MGENEGEGGDGRKEKRIREKERGTIGFRMQAIGLKSVAYMTGVGNRRLGVQVHLSESAVAQSYQLEEIIYFLGFLDGLRRFNIL